MRCKQEVDAGLGVEVPRAPCERLDADRIEQSTKDSARRVGGSVRGKKASSGHGEGEGGGEVRGCDKCMLHSPSPRGWTWGRHHHLR